MIKTIDKKMQRLNEPSLNELKKELEKCKIDLELYKRLLEKRERDLKKIHSLKESVEGKFAEMHHAAKFNIKKAEFVKIQIDEETERIANLKLAVKNVDSELDRIGDEKEEIFEQLKHSITQKIFEMHPEAIDEYETLKMHLATANKHKESLEQTKKISLPLFHILKEGSQINLKWGILDFFIGKNPKAHLSRAIHSAISLAEEISQNIQDDRIQNFLNLFLHETKKSWNQELYKGKFTELFQNYSILMTDMEQELTQAQHIVNQQERAMEKWMEKHLAT